MGEFSGGGRVIPRKLCNFWGIVEFISQKTSPQEERCNNQIKVFMRDGFKYEL